MTAGFLRRRRYRFYPGELADIAAAIARGRVESGPAIAAFEAALAAYHGGGKLFTVNSGRVGLLLLLEALGLAAGDEILVPAYTLRALVELLEQSGYVPVPVDIGPGFNLDPDQIPRRAGPRTRAILATHLFGRPCQIDALRDLADRHGWYLLEDCAQALGAEVGGRRVGRFGHGAIFSFDLLKAVNTFGGGAILVDAAEVAGRLREQTAALTADGSAVIKRVAVALTEHAALVGPAAPLLVAVLGHPWTRPVMTRAYRAMQHAVRPTAAAYSNLQANIGLRMLAVADARMAVRRDQSRHLAAALGESTAPPLAAGDNGYFFVRRVRGDAGELRRRLLWRGIDAGVGAEVADYCGDLGRGADCPRAREAFAQAIQLPLHEGLCDPDLDRIAAACAGQLHPDR